MSNLIRIYRAPKREGPSDYYDLKVIAAGVGDFKELILNIDGWGAKLSSEQQLDLIATISRRLLLRQGFRATESDQCLTVMPDGSLLVEKETEPEEITR
jgi:hypothetical protein